MATDRALVLLWVCLAGFGKTYWKTHQVPQANPREPTTKGNATRAAQLPAAPISVGKAGWHVRQPCHPATPSQLLPAHREREQHMLWQVTLAPFTFSLLHAPCVAEASPLVTQLPHPPIFLACSVKIFLLFPHTRISPVPSCYQSGHFFFFSLIFFTMHFVGNYLGVG